MIRVVLAVGTFAILESMFCIANSHKSGSNDTNKILTFWLQIQILNANQSPEIYHILCANVVLLIPIMALVKINK